MSLDFNLLAPAARLAVLVQPHELNAYFCSSSSSFEALLDCLSSKFKFMASRPASAFAPKTLAMFSLVDGFDLVANAVILLPLANVLLTDNLTSMLMQAYA